MPVRDRWLLTLIVTTGIVGAVVGYATKSPTGFVAVPIMFLILLTKTVLDRRNSRQ
jgi:uncharacterized membrane protein